jgi:predicted nucleotidyltransferase
MANAFGLLDSDIQEICIVFKKFPQITKAVVFGSRAMHTYKPGSDVDIALFGALDFDTVCKVSYCLNEESCMPYKFDILAHHTVDNDQLKQHINQYGKLLYSSTK